LNKSMIVMTEIPKANSAMLIAVLSGRDFI